MGGKFLSGRRKSLACRRERAGANGRCRLLCGPPLLLGERLHVCFNYPLGRFNNLLGTDLRPIMFGGLRRLGRWRRTRNDCTTAGRGNAGRHRHRLPCCGRRLPCCRARLPGLKRRCYGPRA